MKKREDWWLPTFWFLGGVVSAIVVANNWSWWVGGLAFGGAYLVLRTVYEAVQVWRKAQRGWKDAA